MISRLPSSPKIILTITTLALGLAHTVRGAIQITQNFVIPADSQIIGPTGDSTTLDPFEYLSLTPDQFDPSLGTLNGIQLFYDLSFTATGTAGDSGGGISITFGGFFSANDILFSNDGSGNGTGGGPDSEFNIMAGISPNEPSLSSFQFDLIVDEVTGTGTFDLVLEGDFEFDISSVGLTNGVVDYNGGTVAWTYDYTPIPEPKTYGILFALAIATQIGMYRKRPSEDI
ncbi:MAG: hypothetical protein AAF065_01800 [Verrucomicrobiota bacterium]